MELLYKNKEKRLFLEELSQEELDNYENRLITTIKLIIKTLNNSRQTETDIYGWKYFPHKQIGVKYKRWRFTISSLDISLRGSSGIGTLRIQYVPNEKYNPLDSVMLMDYSGTYHSHNLILWEICSRFELNSAAEFDKFINKLNSVNISIV